MEKVNLDKSKTILVSWMYYFYQTRLIAFKRNYVIPILVIYPLSPSMEFDLKDEEENEDEDDIISKSTLTSAGGSTKTRLQSSSYREKAGHIAATS